MNMPMSVNPGAQDSRMTTPLKFIYCLIMAFALFIVIGAKFPAFGKMFMAREPVDYILGDQYRMCDLDRFREKIPVVRPGPNPPLEEAEVMTLGDSFFNSALGSDKFANELGKKLGLKIHNLSTDDFFEPQSYPLSYLEKIGYQGGRKRILILESVERSVLERAEKYDTVGVATSNRIDALAFKVLKNNDIEYFFKQNVLVKPVGNWLKNFRFQYLNIVDKSIGAYTLDPDMLFYQRDLEFDRMKKSEALLDSTADSIAKLAETLKSRYDIELVYLPIANKFSVYHGWVPGAKPYDDFMPRLCRKLTERGVVNLDSYTLYSHYNKPEMPLLYFASDTHYTAHGKALLLEACADLVRKLRGSGNDTEESSVAHPGNYLR